LGTHAYFLGTRIYFYAGVKIFLSRPYFFLSIVKIFLGTPVWQVGTRTYFFCTPFPQNKTFPAPEEPPKTSKEQPGTTTTPKQVEQG
jgi:hypothetical protein